jgi:hypothetical protein
MPNERSSSTVVTGLGWLVNFYEDLLLVAFAPDGKQVSEMGYAGFYLMKPDSSQLGRMDRPAIVEG